MLRDPDDVWIVRIHEKDGSRNEHGPAAQDMAFHRGFDGLPGDVHVEIHVADAVRRGTRPSERIVRFVRDVRKRGCWRTRNERGDERDEEDRGGEDSGGGRRYAQGIDPRACSNDDRS